MKTIECTGLIFDLDGVLVDSSQVIIRHWQQWAQKKGLALEPILRIAQGLRTEDTIRRIAPQLDAAEEARRFEAGESADLEGVCALHGAAALLGRLRQGEWAVATSGTRDVARPRMLKAGLPLPSVLVTADEVTRGKPAPEIFLTAAARLGISPADCLVFEDAPAGVEAGIAAGMRVVGVASSHEPVALTGALTVVKDLAGVSVEGTQIQEKPAARRLRLVLSWPLDQAGSRPGRARR